eukprot:gene14531-biopygen10900
MLERPPGPLAARWRPLAARSGLWRPVAARAGRLAARGGPWRPPGGPWRPCGGLVAACGGLPGDLAACGGLPGDLAAWDWPPLTAAFSRPSRALVRSATVRPCGGASSKMTIITIVMLAAESAWPLNRHGCSPPKPVTPTSGRPSEWGMGTSESAGQARPLLSLERRPRSPSWNSDPRPAFGAAALRPRRLQRH